MPGFLPMLDSREAPETANSAFGSGLALRVGIATSSPANGAPALALRDAVR
jgi:hypothetical protein